MKPLLAHVYEPHRVTYPCYVQPKLNGIRALYQNGHFQSRDEIPFPKGLLDHLAQPLLGTFGPGIILDGELYVHGWPLQRINAAVTPVRQQPTEDTKLVEYHVFDVVDFNKSFHERFARLSCSVNLSDRRYGQVYFVQWNIPDEQATADKCYVRFVDTGYEGMMYRLGDCPYTVPKQVDRKWLDPGLPKVSSKFLSDKNNRCWHLLKRKDWQDDEFECVGLVEGEGRLKGILGAAVCASHATRPGEGRHSVFSVGSGFTDAERSHFLSHPELIIGHLIKVKYLVLSSDGIPLNPTMLAVL